MDKQDIQTILDSLDVQVSLGRIDQATYDTLKQKWMQQLQEITKDASNGTLSSVTNGTHPGVEVVTATRTATLSLSASSPEEPPHYTIEVLACPKCAAPTTLQVGHDLTQPVQCPFCDTVYTVRQSQDNAQQFKKELKAWLDQLIVGSGYNGTSSVDVNARRFIFSESLYPTLKKDIDRRLEAFENILEAPLVQLKETKDFSDYRPDKRLIAMANGDNQWLKTLSTRVLSSQLQAFAVVPDDKQKLLQLQMRVLSLIYYANIAQHQLTSTAPSYQVVRQNVVALQKDYQSHAQEFGGDEHYISYIHVLDERVKGDILLLDLLISALGEEQNRTPETLLLQINSALAQLDKAYQSALTCTYNPLYIIPLQQGIQKDITIAHIVQAVITCFEVVTRTQEEEFKFFYARVMCYIQSLDKLQSPTHLLWLLTSVERVLLARTGVAPLPIVKDWSWLDAAVEANRRKSTLGTSNEVGQVLARHYHPYWVARFSYSALGGILVKKATVHEGFLLVDATSAEKPLVTPVMATDAAQPLIQIGLQHFQLLDKQIISLPAVLPHDLAERAMKVYARTHETGSKILAIRMIGVLYLPVAYICYTVKDKQRNVIIGCLNGVNQHVGHALKQTHDFLQYQV